MESIGKNNLAKWHTLKEKNLKDRSISLNEFEENKFLKNLNRIGYEKIKKLIIIYIKNLFKAFQRKFRQSLINGKSDKECLLISKTS